MQRTGGMQNAQLGNQTSSPRTTSNVNQAALASKAATPADRTPHTSLGVIIGVHEKEAKVQVKIAGKREPFANGSWLPVTMSIDNIYLMYGQLRKGMSVRVHWVGKNVNEAKRGDVDIIGDETADMLKQVMPDNDIVSAPYKFTGGGLSSF